MLINLLYMSHSLREYVQGRHVYRMGIARMVGVDSTLGDPNAFGGSLVYALPIALAAARYSDDRKATRSCCSWSVRPIAKRPR